ncbi:MAG: hypothetical protein EON48_08180 [Acetobacteraceae bacterium]|nr:MAG: hypothetical protein EON48_08180 [Acetobacteraceae bacterium]
MAQRILTTSVPKPSIDLSAALTRVARLTRRSPVKVALDVMAAMLSAQKLTAAEYFGQGAWLGSPTEYVGATSNLRLNKSLTAAGKVDLTALMHDKYLTGIILEANGFPVPRLKAVFSTDRAYSAETLRTPEALANWIGDAGNTPAFGKPVDGSMALGSIPLRAAARGMVDVGGREVEAAALAREVAKAFPRGWLIQELLRQPAEIETLIGPGIGTLRVVTLWEAAGPQILYGVWRHPAVGTWVDAAIFGRPNVGCALDPATGETLSAHLGDHFNGKPITHSLVTPDLPLVGYHLPGWRDITRICTEAHRLFPGHALLGWDIAVTERGPVISELNTNPLHMSYQRAFKRGFLNKDHVSRLDAARALMAGRVGKSVGP